MDENGVVNNFDFGCAYALKLVSKLLKNKKTSNEN